MLLDKSQAVDINDVVSIMLLNGHEVVGRLTERTIDSVFLAKPIRIMLDPISPGQVGVSMLPVLGSVASNQTMQIPLSAMAIRPVRTGDEMRAKYLEITTGLVTPTAEQRSIIT